MATGHSMSWDGTERRENHMFSKDFYDKMMEVHNDLKHMVKWSKDHDERDDIRFNDTNKKVDWVTKVAYMGLGAIAVIEVLINVLK